MVKCEECGKKNSNCFIINKRVCKECFIKEKFKDKPMTLLNKVEASNHKTNKKIIIPRNCSGLKEW